MPEDDQISVGEPTTQSTRSSRPAPAVVHHGHPHPAELEQPALGEKPSELAVVVAEHGVGLGQRLQLGQRLSGRDVTGVEDDVGPGHASSSKGSMRSIPLVRWLSDRTTTSTVGSLADQAADVNRRAGAGRTQTPTAPKESCMAAAAPRRWSNVVVISGSTRRVTAHMYRPNTIPLR